MSSNAKPVKEWSSVPATGDGNNNVTTFSADVGGWPEGMERRQVNDSARHNLAALKAWYLDSEWITPYVSHDLDPAPSVSNSGSTITITGFDATTWATSDRRVRLTSAGSGILYANVSESVAASYAGGNTSFTVDNQSATIPGDINLVEFHASATLPRGAFSNVSSGFKVYVPEEATSAGINAAVTKATASGGGDLVWLADTSYTITAPIDLSSVTLVGRGVQSTYLNCSADIESVLNINGPNVSVQDMSIVGAGPAGMAVDVSGFTSGGHGIKIMPSGSGVSVSYVNIDNVYVAGTFGHGIYSTDSSTGQYAPRSLGIRKCYVYKPGASGIYMDNDSWTTYGPRDNFITDVRVEQPGESITTEACGVKISGGCTLKGVSIEGLNEDAIAGRLTGIVVEKQGTSSRQARDCSVSDFTIRGTGDNSRGILIGSVDSSICNGTIEFNLDDASIGIEIQGDSGWKAENNIVSDIAIRCGGKGVHVNNQTQYNRISNVRCRGGDTGPHFVVGGDWTTIHGCESVSSSGLGAYVTETTSDNSVFQSCIARLPGSTTSGIYVAGGTGNSASGCLIHGLTAAVYAIKVLAAATDTVVVNNNVPGHSDEYHLSDLGTTTERGISSPRMQMEAKQDRSAGAGEPEIVFGLTRGDDESVVLFAKSTVTGTYSASNSVSLVIQVASDPAGGTSWSGWSNVETQTSVNPTNVSGQTHAFTLAAMDVYDLTKGTSYKFQSKVGGGGYSNIHNNIVGIKHTKYGTA